jgi:hypothetical protein
MVKQFRSDTAATWGVLPEPLFFKIKMFTQLRTCSDSAARQLLLLPGYLVVHTDKKFLFKQQASLALKTPLSRRQR